MGCYHVNCGDIDKVWLPFEVNGEAKGLRPHPYCIHCGVVKNQSSKRLWDIGDYMNVLASINKHITKLTKVQLRLIDMVGQLFIS